MSSSSPSSQEGWRFTEYTATDHQAPLWVATHIAVTYAGLFLVVRLAVKYKVLGLDDALLGLAHLAGFAEFGVTYAAMKQGVGQAAGASSGPMAAKLVFASRILTVLTVGLTKCSVVLFLRQIFSGSGNRKWNVCTTIFLCSCIWTVVSTVIVSAGCQSSEALLLESQSKCRGDTLRWKLVVAIDVCFEIILIIIPAFLFKSVQISKSRKWSLFGAFVPRVVVPAFFILFLTAYVHFRNRGGSSIDAVGSMIWQQVLCGYGLISATTPCLKGFLGRFRTEDLARITDNGSHTHTYTNSSRHRTHGDTYALESVARSKIRSRRNTEYIDTEMLALRPSDGLHSAVASGGANVTSGEGSLKSFGSDKMMIHRKVEYDVTTS